MLSLPRTLSLRVPLLFAPPRRNLRGPACWPVSGVGRPRSRSSAAHLRVRGGTPQDARIVVFDVAVADIRAVDDEDNGVTAGIVALPQLTQTQLAAYIPDLEVHIRQRQRRHVLADSRYGLELRVRVLGKEERLGLLVERRLAGIVESQEYDRVFFSPPREQV